ncbi:hypothetical protein [Pantoea anthophila]|uniref:hypothetical protein n=1 Tax=Pantoea anthophila TaxID=470931 RepID=UPI00278AFD49|nr:hypothetical protein [Pantoea anthophila]MDQ1215116.1 hypothetical protein [Pantoea anthophila]
MAVTDIFSASKNVVEYVRKLEKQAASRSEANWHEGLKNSTKSALEKINAAHEANLIGTEESLSLKQRVYRVQDKLIALALW